MAHLLPHVALLWYNFSMKSMSAVVRVRLPVSLRDRIRAAAKVDGRSVSGWLRRVAEKACR